MTAKHRGAEHERASRVRLSDIPEVAATPLSALSGGSTPPDLHFLRNHYAYPAIDSEDWALAVGGVAARPLATSLAALRRLPAHTVDAVLECAGHRRADFRPPAAGVKWDVGAVSQGRWTGTPLAHLLAEARIDGSAAEVVLVGADGDLEAGFARAIPVQKALEETTLLAWELDGGPIPFELGGPLRALVPGHYAVDSVKWLRRIDVVTDPFQGPFQRDDYRLFGAADVPDGEPLEPLPVTSLVTAPEADTIVTAGRTRVRGVAWGGPGVAAVAVQVDDEAWRPARLEPPAGPFAFVPWELDVAVVPGEHTIAARATDYAGRPQPDLPLWNERGYANNSVHRVAVVARPADA